MSIPLVARVAPSTKDFHRGCAVFGHALNCSVIECDGYSERWLSSARSIQQVYVKDEWAVIYRDVVGEKWAKLNAQLFARTFGGDRGVRKERALRIPSAPKHSRFGTSVLPSDDQVRQGMMVEPPATVELSLFSAGFMMSRTIFSLSRSERVETWLVRPANESVRTMTDSCLVTCLLQKKVIATGPSLNWYMLRARRLSTSPTGVAKPSISWKQGITMVGAVRQHRFDQLGRGRAFVHLTPTPHSLWRHAEACSERAFATLLCSQVRCGPMRSEKLANHRERRQLWKRRKRSWSGASP